MSKNIFDEALELIPNIRSKYTYGTGGPLKEEKDAHIDLIKNALEQAQNQEKLLGHYKDLAEVRKELYDLTINFKHQNFSMNDFIIYTRNFSFRYY